jgi:hypothetical protein
VKAYSKEFDEAMAMFEKVAAGMRFEKPTIREREHIPAGYGWYNDGKTNDAFNMFLHGCAYQKHVYGSEIDCVVSDMECCQPSLYPIYFSEYVGRLKKISENK